VSGVLVVVLTPPRPGDVLTYDRFLDALVGGGVEHDTAVAAIPELAAPTGGGSGVSRAVAPRSLRAAALRRRPSRP
jgi:hypothetical protein